MEFEVGYPFISFQAGEVSDDDTETKLYWFECIFSMFLKKRKFLFLDKRLYCGLLRAKMARRKKLAGFGI